MQSFLEPAYLLVHQPLKKSIEVGFLYDENQKLGSIKTEEKYRSNLNNAENSPKTTNISFSYVKQF